MTTRSLRLANVVITGASSGIGRAAAHAFARQGARLVLASRDAEALDQVVDECKSLGSHAIAVPTDVTQSAEVENLASSAAVFGEGRIDVWINNAGVGAVGGFDDTPLAAHEQVVQTDLLGYLRGAYVALPYFKKQNAGILINTLSVGSWVAQPYAAAYSASKYGLRGLTEALRGELTQWANIHVCDVYPAVMDTPGFRDGGNYTGSALKPPPPLYDPRLVADAMVELALNPKASKTVGATATALRLGHFLIPGFAQLAGLVTSYAFKHANRSAQSSGNLFHIPGGARGIDGGWRTPSTPSSRLLYSAAAVAVGAGVWWCVNKRLRH